VCGVLGVFVGGRGGAGVVGGGGGWGLRGEAVEGGEGGEGSAVSVIVTGTGERADQLECEHGGARRSEARRGEARGRPRESGEWEGRVFA
jgi:hypothetical protein